MRAKKLAKLDLLPVVSNPTLEVSPRSRMQGIGKTPSILNSKGQVAGFTDWTAHMATVGNVEAWQKVPHYGICIQTRTVRALDIDIPNKALAKKIRLRFLDLLGLDEIPRRWRADSGKELLAFKVSGVPEGEDLTRRSFVVKAWEDETTGKTKRWLVEFLATGQQFIAAGTHPDGERYQWDGDGFIPEEAPTIALKVWEHAWGTLANEFMLEGTEEKARSLSEKWSKAHDEADIEDEAAEWLDEHGLVLEKGRGGVWSVACPWADGHSPSDSVSATVWLCRKAGGREGGDGSPRGGVFDCKHAGCRRHTTLEYLQRVGFVRDSFSDLSREEVDGGEAPGGLAGAGRLDPGGRGGHPADARRDRGGHAEATGDRTEVADAEAAPEASARPKELKASLNNPLPGFIRHTVGKNQVITTNLENITRALVAPQAVGCHLSFDDFRGELLYAEKPGEWQPLTDGFAAELAMRIERLDFHDQISVEKLRRALDWVSIHYRMDTAKTWLMDVAPAWDGVARIHRFWPDHMQTKDTPYTRALGSYSWTAQAGRVLDPGCKVDMVPVLVGEEGTRKSTAISLIAPNEDFFAEFNLALDDEKLARFMRGCLVGELAELRGVSVRDAESVLAWVVRRHEKWTPKFKEYTTTLARRVVFYGTTNDPEFLQAHMGFRRWLPVLINGIIDTDLIERDRLQLWAEARDVYLHDGGVQFREVEELAKAERDTFRHVDAWHDQIGKWGATGLDSDDTLTPFNCGTLTTEQVLTECLGFERSRIKKADQMRAAEVLKAHGMARILRRLQGKPTRVWIAAKAVTGIGAAVTGIGAATAKRLSGG